MGIQGKCSARQCSSGTRIRNGVKFHTALIPPCYHGIRYLLGYFDRYRQHAYIDIVLPASSASNSSE